MAHAPEVDAREAMALVAEGNGYLLDVREQPEWDLGHSPFAALVPMSQLQARIDEIPSDQRLLVVCLYGQRSARVAAALVEAGYNAANITGGMIAWHAAGGEIVADDGRTPRVD